MTSGVKFAGCVNPMKTNLSVVNYAIGFGIICKPLKHLNTKSILIKEPCNSGLLKGFASIAN